MILTVAAMLLLLSVAVAGEEQDITGVLARIPDDPLLAAYSHPAWDRLIELRETGAGWVDAKTWERARKDLEAVIDHLGRLKSDPFYPAFFRLRANVRFHPVYKDYDHRVHTRFPWVVFVDSADDPAEADRLAKKTLDTLATVQESFFLLFGERLELAPPAAIEPPGLRILKVFLFRHTDSFKRCFPSSDDRVSSSGNSRYRWSDQWVVATQDLEREDPTFHLRIGHDAAHQLMHLYTKVVMERDDGAEVLWTDNRTRSRCSWFREGVAEFLAGGMKVRRDRLAQWKATRSSKRLEWSLEELLKSRTAAEIRARASRMALGRYSEVARLEVLFHAEAWAFVHFLYHHDDGKYREKLLAYAANEFHGRSGPAVFQRKWSMGETCDWAPLEKEWREYVEGLQD